MSEIKPIRNEADYEAALVEVERLWGASSGTPEGDRLDVLATLIDAYESKHHPIDPADPIEAIKFRMEQQGLTRKDLESILGTRTRVAEVLNRRRGLSINMIRNLHERLGVSAKVLIQPSSPPGHKDQFHDADYRNEENVKNSNRGDFDKIVDFIQTRWPGYMHAVYQLAMLKVVIAKDRASVVDIAESISKDDSDNDGKNYVKKVREVVGKVLERHGLVVRKGDEFELVHNQLTREQRQELIRRCDTAICAYSARIP